MGVLKELKKRLPWLNLSSAGVLTLRLFRARGNTRSFTICCLRSKSQRKAVQAAETLSQLKEALGEGKYTALLQAVQRARKGASDCSNCARSQLLQELAEKMEGELRKKATDEVAEASATPSEDSPLHGGDGNSQEVEADSLTSSPEAEGRGGEAKTLTGEKGTGEGTFVSSEKSSAGRNSGNAGAGKGNGRGKKSSETLAHGSKMATMYGKPQKKNDAQGNSAIAFLQPIDPCTSEEAKSLKNALERFFKDTLASGKASEDNSGMLESPRVDAYKLVKELVSKRYALARASKEELSSVPRRIIIAADVSGSCSASSGATVGICRALCDIWPEIVFVTHVNGLINTIEGKTVSTEDYAIPTGVSYDEAARQSAPLWKQLSKGAVGALFFGDVDGIELWSNVWQDRSSMPVLWLDSYCASYGVVKATQPQKIYSHYVDRLAVCLRSLKYFKGVHDAKSAACAIRQALRMS